MSSPALLFACPICLDALVQPVLATCCGQSFCDVCLREALAKTDACPLCREPLLSGPHSATRNRALEELLARLPVSTEHEVLLEIQSEVDATSDDQTAPIGRRWLGIAAVAVRARQYLWCLRWIPVRGCEGCSSVQRRQWRHWCRVHWSSLQCAFYAALFVVFVFFLRVQEEEFAEHQHRRL